MQIKEDGAFSQPWNKPSGPESSVTGKQFDGDPGSPYPFLMPSNGSFLSSPIYSSTSLGQGIHIQRKLALTLPRF
jgi:hypothetical protein